MLDALVNIWNFLISLWSSMTDTQKEAAKQFFADLFDEVFRAFYRQAQAGGTA